MTAFLIIWEGNLIIDISSFSVGPAIEVIVGRSESFTVHEYLLRQSPFFDRMLNGTWKEATERRVELPEDDPDVFTIYVSWLYWNQIPTIPTCESGQDDSEFLHLIQTYIFGDKIQDMAFQNTIVDAIIEKNRDSVRQGLPSKQSIPSPACVRLAYDNTLSGSPLRRLLVDLWALTEGGKVDKETPRRFLEDLIIKIRPSSGKRLARTTRIESGLYHHLPPDKSWAVEMGWLFHSFPFANEHAYRYAGLWSFEGNLHLSISLDSTRWMSICQSSIRLTGLQVPEPSFSEPYGTSLNSQISA